MLSKPLIFYARILTTLFVLIIYFPKAAPAQQLDVPKLIDLSIPNDSPTETIKSEKFVVYGRAPSKNLAGIVGIDIDRRKSSISTSTISKWNRQVKQRWSRCQT